MANFNKEQARQTILTTAKNIIITCFNPCEKRDVVKDFKQDNYTVSIKKKCTHPNSKFKTYSEEYSVQYKGTIQGKLVDWSFYLERVNITDYSVIEFIDPKGTSQNKLIIRNLKH